MKKKKSILKTVLGSIIVLFLLMVGVALGSDTEPPVITPNNQIVEYDTVLKFADLALAEDNRSEQAELSMVFTPQDGFEIDQENQSITFSSVGTFEVEVTSTDEADNTSQGVVLVEVTDTQAPEIISVDCEKTVGYNKKLSLVVNENAGKNVVAVQAEDKSDIMIQVQQINTSDHKEAESSVYQVSTNKDEITFLEIGKYEILLAIQDSYGNAVEETINMEIVDEIAPSIKCSQKSFSITDTDKNANYFASLTATDEIDGDLSELVEIDDSKVKYGKAGEYSVAVSVSDNSGNICKTTIPVVIKDTTAPKLSLSKDSFTLTTGDSAPDYEDIVSAIDAVDGDLTGKIIIDDSDVDYDSAGTYTVTCKVADDSGNSVTKKITVKVKSPSTSSSYSSSGSSGGGGNVMITRNGECYHTHKCGNGNYFWVTYEEAISRGLRACQKCY